MQLVCERVLHVCFWLLVRMILRISITLKIQSNFFFSLFCAVFVLLFYWLNYLQRNWHEDKEKYSHKESMVWMREQYNVWATQHNKSISSLKTRNKKNWTVTTKLCLWWMGLLYIVPLQSFFPSLASICYHFSADKIEPRFHAQFFLSQLLILNGFETENGERKEKATK